MRCPQCEQLVHSVKFCPNCGTQITNNGTATENEPRGEFKGRLDESGDRAHSGRVSVFRGIMSLMKDPGAPRSAKTIIVLAAFYIILPLDFLPGGLIPVIGWLDDIIVGLLAWHLVKDEVNRYR